MNKGLWLTIGLLVVLAATLFGIRSLFNPTTLSSTNALDTDTKILMNFEKFEGYHHDAEILLNELMALKIDTERSIAAKDPKLLAIATNNIYRVVDNININRVATIALFEVCDEALDSLSLYAVNAKTYYANANNGNLNQLDELKSTFSTKFDQCQSVVNDKPVEALYQDYQ
jgi:hypothetical protein